MLKRLAYSIAIILLIFSICLPSPAYAGEQPIAIFHAFNLQYKDVEGFVCDLAEQGYSHIQISPAQKSNPGPFESPLEWAQRYQPIDYGVIDGLGTEDDLKQLVNQAHDCNVKVIADIVFNHMANIDNGDGFEDLTKYPNLSPADFKTKSEDPENGLGEDPCRIGGINYNDGDTISEIYCWLGGLPDLKFTDNVKNIQKDHLKTLLNLGIDGFRFDAAKHMPPEVVKEYIDFIDTESNAQTWNYLEVIEDNDTPAENYNWIAAVTDFLIYNSMKEAYSFGGDLRNLPGNAVNDRRSVTFGRNHDSAPEIRKNQADAYNAYDDVTDSYLATAYILAREDGTPLILDKDNLNSPYIKYGVKFRQIISQRGAEDKNVKESILRVINKPTILVLERGPEGFLVENKAIEKLDLPVLDLTLTNLEGCYRELRNNFNVTIEKNSDGKKYVTGWGTSSRGGIEIEGRDALYFIREPWESCPVNF